MIARGKGGAIVNMSSIGGRVALENVPSYCASKGAIEMLTKVMTRELGQHQVRQQTFNVEYTYLCKTRALKCWYDYIRNIAYICGYYYDCSIDPKHEYSHQINLSLWSV